MTEAGIRLCTSRLVLRELAPTDLHGLLAVEGDPAVARFLPRDALTEEQARSRLEQSMAAATMQPRRIFDLAITEPANDLLIGRMVLMVVRPEHGEAEAGFSLRRDLWGRGYVTEGLAALLRFAFDTLHLHRVYGECDPRNLGSARAMEKVGMRREGHLRETWWLKGEWCDSLVYAVLATEWPR